MDQQLAAAEDQTAPSPAPAPGPAAGQGGFTMIEVLIALVVLLIGLAGVMSMQLSAMQATEFDRHASEASTLAQDKMEWLRTQSSTDLASGSDQVDARGVPDANGLFARDWTVATGTDNTTLTVSVTWNEGGAEPYTITMSTLRAQ